MGDKLKISNDDWDIERYEDVKPYLPKKEGIEEPGDKSKPIKLAILDTIAQMGILSLDDGPDILQSMSDKTLTINSHKNMTLYNVKMRTTRDRHRTCYTSANVDVEHVKVVQRFRLKIVFKHQENPEDTHSISAKLRYRPISVDLN